MGAPILEFSCNILYVQEVVTLKKKILNGEKLTRALNGSSTRKKPRRNRRGYAKRRKSTSSNSNLNKNENKLKTDEVNFSKEKKVEDIKS